MDKQALVTKYVEVNAEQKELKAKCNELREKLIPFLRENDCPAKGPYILELNDIERTEFKWEEFARKLAKELWGPAAKKLIRKAIARAGKKKVPTILIKPNAKWKG